MISTSILVFGVRCLLIMIASFVSGVGPFEVGFNQNMPSTKVGMLSSVSSLLCEEMDDARLHLRDVAAISIFRSDGIDTRKGHSAEQLMTAFSSSFGSVFVVSPDDLRLKLGDERALDRPFYRAFELKDMELTEEWLEVVLEGGYSWNWENGILNVSNTLSSRYGLPPNFRHLGIMPLELGFHVNDEFSPTGPPKLLPSSPGLRVEGESWKELMVRFQNNPNHDTYRSLHSDEASDSEFLGMKNLPQYRPGSRKKKWTTELVGKFNGPSNCATFPDLASALSTLTAGCLLTQFILLKKLVGQSMVSADRKTVYYFK